MRSKTGSGSAVSQRSSVASPPCIHTFAMLIHQPRGTLEILRQNGVFNRLARQALPLEPGACPEVEIGPCRVGCALAMTQHLAKQMMVAVPAPLVVERNAGTDLHAPVQLISAGCTHRAPGRWLKCSVYYAPAPDVQSQERHRTASRTSDQGSKSVAETAGYVAGWRSKTSSMR